MEEKSKDLFKVWLKRTRYSLARLKEVEKQIDYYQNKCDYSSPAFDHIGSKSNDIKDPYEFKTRKLFELEHEQRKLNEYLKTYYLVRSKLKGNSLIIFNEYLFGNKSVILLSKELGISRNRVYDSIESIKKVYLNL